MANKKDTNSEIEKKKTTSKKDSTNKPKTSSKKVNKVVKEEPKMEKKKTIKIKDDKKVVESTEVKNDKKNIVDETIIKDNDKILGIFEKIVILVAVAFVFSLLGYFIGSDHNEKINYSTATKDLQIFIEQYNKILEEYYKDVDKEELIKGAISGMLSTLDGYSGVIDDCSNNFNITLEGEYEGLGIEIINNAKGEIEIYNVYEDTPASEAGIKIGDIITKSNDVSLQNVSTKDFVKMISNAEKNKLVLLRNGKEITVELKKEKIVLKSVSYEMLEEKIGYIKVDLFANNTQVQFKEALETLQNQELESLIIDLRNNTGGHLSTVKEMLGLFLDNSHPIYQTESKTETLKFYSNGNKDKEYKIVILQNEVSASASEIMASALSEQLDAYIIGNTSYGKGTVQQLETVEGVGQYKFTTKKWLTSEGVWLEGTGLKPDLEVSLSLEYYENPTQENDTQLQEAIKYLNKK